MDVQKSARRKAGKGVSSTRTGSARNGVQNSNAAPAACNLTPSKGCAALGGMNIGADGPSRPLSPVIRANKTREPARRWRSKPGTPKIVAKYLAKAGLVARLPYELYKSDLVERFGHPAEQYLRDTLVVQLDNGESHGLMSANLDMALEIRSQIWGHRTEEFLSWFATANLPAPGRILDIGCDIGIQACFYAMFFPDSQVTGLDRCPKSIECAKQLAERLKLKNVQFVQADLRELPDDLASQKFDLVVSSCMVGHFFDKLAIPVRSIEEAQSQAKGPELTNYARSAAGFLAGEDSLLVSFERLAKPVQLARWIWALRDAGVHVLGDGIELLEFEDESEESLSLPVLIGSRRVTELVTPDEIRELWLECLREHLSDSAYKMAATECLFVSASPKELLWGLRRARPGLPPYCTELWKAGSSVLFYVYRDGCEAFDEFPAEDLPVILKDFRLATRDDIDGKTVVEYGPEAHSQPPASVSDGSTAERLAQAVPGSAAIAESGGTA